MMLRAIALSLLSATFMVAAVDPIDYRVLATNKTSTMEKELNQAADAGYRMERTMGGESGFGGSEVVAVMSKNKNAPGTARYAYKLLATAMSAVPFMIARPSGKRVISNGSFQNLSTKSLCRTLPCGFSRSLIVPRSIGRSCS